MINNINIKQQEIVKNEQKQKVIYQKEMRQRGHEITCSFLENLELEC